MRLLYVLLACLTLSACQSSPKKNYYLLATPTDAQAAHNNSPITTLVGIGPIEIADYLNRLRIIYQTGDNTVVVSDNDYWAEPLDKGIPRVVAFHLAQLDGSRSFVNFPWRTDSIPKHSIRIHVHSMTVVEDKAQLNATWEIFDTVKKTNIERRYFSQSTPAKNNSKDIAKAYSELLTKMSDEIHESLKKL